MSLTCQSQTLVADQPWETCRLSPYDGSWTPEAVLDIWHHPHIEHGDQVRLWLAFARAQRLSICEALAAHIGSEDLSVYAWVELGSCHQAHEWEPLELLLKHMNSSSRSAWLLGHLSKLLGSSANASSTRLPQKWIREEVWKNHQERKILGYAASFGYLDLVEFFAPRQNAVLPGVFKKALRQNQQDIMTYLLDQHMPNLKLDQLNSEDKRRCDPDMWEVIQVMKEQYRLSLLCVQHQAEDQESSVNLSKSFSKKRI